MKTKAHEEFEYKAEMKQLLHLIIHSLYTHPEVFLRELISNASDALNKVRFRELTDKTITPSDKELSITIAVDPKKHTFSITDNGIGMTRDELVNNLGTIAKSGTLEFVQKLQEAKKTTDVDNLIGQFGVGFYSIFMVTDNVIVETRHAGQDARGYRWQSQGHGTFTIEEIEKKERGTTISFIFNEKSKEFSDEHRIKGIIKKYSNFVDFPISLGSEKVNSVQALWHKKAAEITKEEANEFYKFIANDFSDPFRYFSHAVEGNVNFKALLFIPQKAPADYLQFREEKSLHLYSNKIFIQDDAKQLLPEYLRFVKGVVDTEDLPLNVSREVTQSSPVMAKINKILTSKVLSFLENLAKNEPEAYAEFHTQFGPILKTGINSDFANRDKIIDLLRFESSRTDGKKLVSLKEYVERMPKEQKEIYYGSGETRKNIEQSPTLEYFRKHDIEVLYLTHPVDIWLMPSLQEYDKKPIKSIDSSDLALLNDKKIETPETKINETLLATFKEELKDVVADVIVSKRLVDSPALLSAAKDGLDPQLEKMMKMMHTDYTAGKKVLEINLEHPLMKNLSRLYLANNQHAMIKQCIRQVYESALLMEGTLTTPADFVKRMTDIMVEATK